MANVETVEKCKNFLRWVIEQANEEFGDLDEVAARAKELLDEIEEE
jgi:hypothetical protein